MLKRILSFLVVISVLVTAIGVPVHAETYSTPVEQTASMFSMHTGTMKGQLNATVLGNTWTNILGYDGDFEKDSNGDGIADGWNRSGPATSFSLDTTWKKYGNKSQKASGVTYNGSFFGKPLVNIKNNNTYLFIVTTKIAKTSGVNSGIHSTFGYTENYSWYGSSISIYLNEGEKTLIRKFTTSANALNNNPQIFAGYIHNRTDETIDISMDGFAIYDLTEMGLANKTEAELAQMISFVNGTKSTDAVRIRSVGKNLVRNGNGENGCGYWTNFLKGTVYEAGLKLSFNDGKFKVSTTVGGGFYQKVKVKKNTSYYLKGNKIGGSSTWFYASSSAGTLTSMNGGTFNTGDADEVYVWMYDATESPTTVYFDSIMLVEGTTAPTTYESYVETTAYINQELNGVGTSKDELNLSSGSISRKMSQWYPIDSSINWINCGDLNGFKYVQSNYPNSIVTFNTSGIGKKYNEVGPLVFGQTSAPDRIFIGSSGEIYITVADTDSGWTEAMIPTSGEMIAYFLGWKMCAADGSTYVSGTKYWKKLTDGTAITSTLPTSSYAGYIPYKLSYCMNNYDSSNVIPQPLIAQPGGSVIVEPVIKSIGVYSGKMSIDNTAFPIKEIESVYKVSKGVRTPVNYTIAADGLYFTVPGAVNGTIYEYTYKYAQELTTLPTIRYSVPLDTSAQIDSMNEIIRSLLDRIAKLESQGQTAQSESSAQVGMSVGPILLNCTQGQNLNLAMSASNIQDLSSRVFTIMYDINDLEVVDLCTTTSTLETSIGIVSGTGITILQYTPGVIKYSVNLALDPGTNWSGVTNTIAFRGKITGETSVTYTVE